MRSKKYRSRENRESPGPKPQAVLRLDFVTPGAGDDKPKTYYARYRPLGIEWTRDSPVKVGFFSFNSHCRTLGIQKDWSITRIGTKRVNIADSFNMVTDWTAEYIKALPPYPLRMDFKVPKERDAVKTLYIEKAPIGIELSRTAPITVKSVERKGYGASLGIEAGWVVTMVGDEKVNDESSHQFVAGLLQAGVVFLPPFPD